MPSDSVAGGLFGCGDRDFFFFLFLFFALNEVPASLITHESYPVPVGPTAARGRRLRRRRFRTLLLLASWQAFKSVTCAITAFVTFACQISSESESNISICNDFRRSMEFKRKWDLSWAERERIIISSINWFWKISLKFCFLVGKDDWNFSFLIFLVGKIPVELKCLLFWWEIWFCGAKIKPGLGWSKWKVYRLQLLGFSSYLAQRWLSF